MCRSKVTKIVALLFLAFMVVSCGISRQRQIEEIKNSRPSYVPAPDETITTLKEFIAYTSRNEPDIFHDDTAQQRFLTDYLRRGVVNHWKTYQEHIKQHETCGFPNNGTFVGAWEYPSDYKIVGDRRYDKRVVIDVSYEWNDSDANYYGTTKLVSYSFLWEEGKWKLDDMYTYNGDFVTAYSLSETLWRDKYE